MRLLETVLAATLLASSVAQTQGATVTAGEALVKADDPRLQRKATFDSDGARIADVLARLSESTGLTMTAGLDKDDWIVYDRKVILHVRMVQLADLMRELASVLRFRWSREGERGKWTYRLWQDKEQRAEEESLRAAAEDAQTKQFREKRENAIADLVNLGSLPENDASALKSTDPWRYVLATEPLGKDLAEFFHSFPEARNALVQGLDLAFPVSSLSPALQDTVRRIAVSYESLSKSIGASEDHSALLSRFDKLQITINRRRLLEPQDAFSQSVLGRITIGGATDSLDVPVLDASSQMARALGAAIVALKSGKSRDEVAKQLQADLTTAAQSTGAPSGPARDILSDPALRRKIKLFSEPAAATLPVTLKALAGKAGLNVVSDCFASGPVAMDAVEKTVGEQLEAIRAAHGSSWEKSGSMLRFRDREWFKKRTWEVPQVWIHYWISRANINDGLQFQDFVQIGNLRDEQIDHTIMLNQSLVNLGAGDAARNRGILRFYGLLSDEQRTTLSTKQLDVGSLSADQWAALGKALATTGAAYAAASKGSQIITLTHSGTDVVDYAFSYYPGVNEPPVVFKLTTGMVFRTGKEVVFPKKKVVFPAPQPK